MITITENGKDALATYFKNHKTTPLRIYMRASWAGTSLQLAQDEPGEFDDVHEVEGYTIVIDKDLAKMAAPITIDSGFRGLKILSRISPGMGTCAR